MEGALSVLVADVNDGAFIELLEEVATRGGEAWVPLIAGPFDDEPHVLEIYKAGVNEPLRMLAKPLGPPGGDRYPLRLSRMEEDVPVNARAEPITLRREVTDDDDDGEEEETKPDLDEDARIETQRLAREGYDDPLVGRPLAGGKLVIERLVGKGMMGAVYQARHRELGMRVAVKVLHETLQRDLDFCRRFYGEALAVSRLDHPNLIRVIDFGQEPDGLLYLAMEFLDGRSLRQVIEEEKRMPVERIAEILSQVTGGLGHAHARGILHRDVKPDNIVLMPAQDDDGVAIELAKLCDFGLSLQRMKDSATSERFAGTPVYMSPEQCRGDELDLRSDVYACGIILYELAAGEVPFLGETAQEIVQKHIHAPLPPLERVRPDIDPRYVRIVNKALSKDRNARHADVRELRTQLRALLRISQELEIPESRPSLPVPPPPMPPVSLPPPAFDLAPSIASPIASPSAPPISLRIDRPDWLEDTGASHASFLTRLATGSGIPTQNAAEVLAKDPGPWLAKLVKEEDPHAFDRLLAELDKAVRVLAAAGDARALWTIAAAVHGIATEPGSPRAQKAAGLGRLFVDPALLGPVAERALVQDDEAAKRLVVRAGVAGAYAAYGARVKHAASQAVRGPFVLIMRALGPAGWPVLKTALSRIPPAALTGGHPRAAELASDLLLSVPPVGDEDAIDLVAGFLRAQDRALVRGAARALGRVSPDRAQPLLVGLLSQEDDGIRAAAVAALREIGAVDADLAMRLAPILTGQVPSSVELLREVIAAVASAGLAARPLASTLANLVRHEGLDDSTCALAARAVLALVGNEARSVLIARMDSSSPALRAELERLLASVKLA